MTLAVLITMQVTYSIPRSTFSVRKNRARYTPILDYVQGGSCLFRSNKLRTKKKVQKRQLFFYYNFYNSFWYFFVVTLFFFSLF